MEPITAGLSAISVVQNIFQAFILFHSLRDFPDDYAYIQLRAALLHESTAVWAHAVGLVDSADENGNPPHTLNIRDPTPERIDLVTEALDRLLEELQEANTAMSKQPRKAIPASEGETAKADDEGKKRAAIKSTYRKLLKTTHIWNPSNPKHPGIIPRTSFVLVHKDKLEGYLKNATRIRDELQQNFPPLDEVPQNKALIETFGHMDMTKEEQLVAVAEMPDVLCKKIFAAVLHKENGTYALFEEVNVTDFARLMVGDVFSKNFNYENFVRPPAKLVTVGGKLNVSKDGTALIGDMHGENPFWRNASSSKDVARENAD